MEGIEFPKLSGYDILVDGIGNEVDLLRAFRLIRDLPLKVESNGFSFGKLELRYNPGNDFFFLLSPERPRASYSKIECLDSKLFEVSFTRVGFEDLPETCFDQLLVQYKKHPRTGIFLRTRPFLTD